MPATPYRILRNVVIAEDAHLIRIEPAEPAAPCGHEAGDHIKVRLPSGRERSYSLVNAPGDTAGFSIAVRRCAEGEGGSSEICGLAAGTELAVHAPLNAFRLRQIDGVSVLVAGGIGITPIWSMAQALHRAGRPWRAYYTARHRSAAPFVAELEELARSSGAELTLAFTAEGQRLDIGRIVAGLGRADHIYCCGPEGMLEAFKAATFLMSDRAHSERFSAVEAAEGGFVVELARSGQTIDVGKDDTILEAVLAQGIEIEYSCMGGTCGTCAARVLDGIPDHRDDFLTEDEKAANDKILICCSGSKSGKLVLDL